MIQALREILAVFKVDTKDLKAGVTEGNKLVNGLKEALGSITGPLAAALTGGAIVGFAHEMLETADATAKTASALGLAAQELQEWQHAAGLSGVAAEQVTVSVTKLGQKIAQARSGNAELAKTFKALNVDMDELADIADQSLGDAFEHVGLALAGVEDEAKRTDLAMKLFEESGPKLFNLFKGGSESIRAMREEVEELGYAFTGEFVADVQDFNDNLARLKMGGQGLLLQFFKPMLPALLEFSQELVRAAKAVIPVVREFVAWIRQTKLLQAAMTLLAGKGLLVGLTAIGKWAVAAGGLTGILQRLLAVVARFLLPLLLLEDVIVFLAGGKSLLGEKLDDWFGPGTSGAVREFFLAFKNAPDDIRQAFASLPADLEKSFGAIGAFFGDLYTIIVDEFLFMIDIMTGGWDNFAAKMKAMGDWMLAAIQIVWVELKFAGLSVAAAVTDAFTTAWNNIVAGAQNAMRTVAKALSSLPLTGKLLAGGVEAAADSLDDAKADAPTASADVSEQWAQARLGLVAELEAAQARMQPGKDNATAPVIATPTYSVPAPSNVTNVTQDVNQTTQVTVTVPAGTPETMANRVGAAAQRGAREGSSQNLRAAQAALVPRPAG